MCDWRFTVTKNQHTISDVSPAQTRIFFFYFVASSSVIVYSVIMCDLPLFHPSFSLTVPSQSSIFPNGNLWSPAVQGAPECVYAELHFITHSCTAANFTLSVVQPCMPWATLFVFVCVSCTTSASVPAAAAPPEKPGWTVNGLWSSNTGAQHIMLRQTT